MAGLKTKAEALDELGLEGTVHDEDIRQAFRQRLKHAHPDINGGTDARLRRLILARDLLMSSHRIHVEYSDPVQEFHTANAMGDGALPLTITLHQALFGGVAQAEVPAFSHTPDVTSLIQSQDLSVTLPCGLRDGEKARLKCAGATRDVMFFKINIETDADCRVWGDDIWMSVQVEQRLLTRGGEAVIETPHGMQMIQIDRDVPKGASLCLKGKGLPATELAPAGNLYIRLEAKPDAVRPVIHVLSEFRQRWAS